MALRKARQRATRRRAPRLDAARMARQCAAMRCCRAARDMATNSGRAANGARDDSACGPARDGAMAEPSRALSSSRRRRRVRADDNAPAALA